MCWVTVGYKHEKLSIFLNSLICNSSWSTDANGKLILMQINTRDAKILSLTYHVQHLHPHYWHSKWWYVPLNVGMQGSSRSRRRGRSLSSTGVLTLDDQYPHRPDFVWLVWPLCRARNCARAHWKRWASGVQLDLSDKKTKKNPQSWLLPVTQNNELFNTVSPCRGSSSWRGRM